MSEQKTDTPSASIADKESGLLAETKDFLGFLVKLLLVIAIFRSFIFSPFNIPSESMQPRLIVGDYLLAAKWPYGYSRYSLPFSLPLIPGRIFPSQPERGDVVVFKAPPDQSLDYIKRVIGLPGDQVEMRDGQLVINGNPVPKERVADFVVKMSPNTNCFAPAFQFTLPDGAPGCHYPQFRETLPNGKSYRVLDLLQAPQDNAGPFIVPEGHVFLMGDNRDNSQDSRFPAVVGGGIGIVPQENLVGRAQVTVFSTDGSANWFLPWTWFSAARWERIGQGF